MASMRSASLPADRWDLDKYYSPTPAAGKMYTREGGFLDAIGDFDAEFFGISAQEACWIDPQHRLLMEVSWEALEDAGIAPHQSAESNVGVFMGIMSQDYAQLDVDDEAGIIDGFRGAGLSHSAGVGRLSYMFGFEGPSHRDRFGQQQFAGRGLPGSQEPDRKRMQHGVGRRRQCDSDAHQFAAAVQGGHAVAGWSLQIVFGRRGWLRSR